jgi:hypothetical protein
VRRRGWDGTAFATSATDLPFLGCSESPGTSSGYPAVGRNPHGFLTNHFMPNPAIAPFALAAQAQIAAFFASDGATTIDPDGSGPIFETPMVGPPPEDLAFIP